MAIPMNPRRFGEFVRTYRAVLAELRAMLEAGQGPAGCRNSADDARWVELETARRLGLASKPAVEAWLREPDEHAVACACQVCWREFRARWGGLLPDALLREAFDASTQAALRAPRQALGAWARAVRLCA